MKLIVDEVVYDVLESLHGASLGDLRRLKKDLGSTVRTINSTFTRLGEESQSDSFDNLSLLEDDDFLQSMIGLIWLAKRKAGVDLSIADAEATPYDVFSLDFDDDDEEVEAVDPKEPETESSDPSV